MVIINKTKIIGLIGFVLYIIGFGWQIFEIIRNIITSTDEMYWQVGALLAAIIAVMISYVVMYILFFANRKTISKKQLKISAVSSIIVILVFGCMEVRSAIQVLSIGLTGICPDSSFGV